MQSDPGQVRAYFTNFGVHQARRTGSPLYAELCLKAADDPEIIELAASCSPTQPSANLLLAAVHALLLAGISHPLREFYPDVLESHEEPREPGDTTYPLFRDFVFQHRTDVEQMLRTRRVQTNVVRRTTVMLPLFAAVARESGGGPLALIELGASGGLNLHWDRYHHTYHFDAGEPQSWGDPSSPLRLSAAVRSPTLPLPTEDLRVASRIGVDLDPVDPADPEQLHWLRALIFPEHRERHVELLAAAEIARAHPARVLRGDATELAAELVERAPAGTTPCLYATMVLNQIPGEPRRRLFDALCAASRKRRLWLLTLDGMPDASARLRIGEFAGGERRTRDVAETHPHGRWLRWL